MIVTVWFDVTGECVRTKIATCDPAAILTVAGTDTTLLFELESLTVNPDVGAAPLRETVPTTFAAEPPTKLVGEILRDARVAGTTVTVVVTALPLGAFAVIVASVEDVTMPALTGN